MKNILLSLITTILLVSTACKESATETDIDAPYYDYYPIKNGSSFVYDIAVSDSNGVTDTGNRYMKFDDSSIVEGRMYSVQKDSFVTLLATQTNLSFLRKSKIGVYSYADTSGLSEFIPDSLREFLSADKEIRLLFYPLILNQRYSVYLISVTTLGINVVNIGANVESEEILNVTLSGTAAQLKTLKIKYTLTVRYSLGPSDETKYEAYIWAVKDIGFVKWEGDAEVLNFIFNRIIFPLGTNVKMDLTDYHF
jgi:hypothetical protein